MDDHGEDLDLRPIVAEIFTPCGHAGQAGIGRGRNGEVPARKGVAEGAKGNAASGDERTSEIVNLRREP
jgi:hypothetical protein